MDSRWVVLSLVVLLAFVLPVWSDAPDTLVLANGERVACEIQGERDQFVLARIGDRTYRIERASLQGAERAGAPLPDAAAVAFVQSVARHLVGADERLKRATRAALEALDDRAAIEAAAAASDSVDHSMAAALRAFAAETK